MDKNGLAEIRKVLRRDDPPVDWIYSFYVSPENDLSWQSFRKWLSLDEDESFRHKDILKKALSGSEGREIFSVGLASQAETLFAVRTLEEANEEVLQDFAGRVIASYPHTDPYYGVLFHITYDVPAMSSDRRRLEDGDVVYQSVVLALCPAQLSKAALGYNDSDGVFELSRRWTIGAPVEGFLYPAFNDRIGDMNEVLYRAKKEISSDLFIAFFDAVIPVTARMQKTAFNTLIDSLNASVESVALIQDDLGHLDGENVSFLEKNETRSLIERCGMDAENFDEAYDEIIGDTPLAVAALKEAAVVFSTDSATIKVPADRAQLVSTREIDGITYLLVPVDGAVVVNGIPAAPSSEK
ncbi:MAG: DUF4317 domain-containing protein [Lachnospiraceae bacterium]|nr:DUF4317 domain-containing protein [Lachnospiraceae bacterium]